MLCTRRAGREGRSPDISGMALNPLYRPVDAGFGLSSNQPRAKASRLSCQICAALAAAGKRVIPYDVLIAGQANARDLTLVTSNTGGFHYVAGLRWKTWRGEGRA